MNSRILINSWKRFSKCASSQTSLYINSRSIYYAAHPYPNDTVKKFMKFLKDNKEQLDYVPPRIETGRERIRRGDEDILNLNADQQKKLKLIKWEYELIKEQNPQYVPVEVNNSEWLELLIKETPTQRRNFLKFLQLTELRIVKTNEQKAAKKLEIVKIPPPPPSPEFQSKLFLWLYSNTLVNGYHERFCESLMNGPYCVVDMGFAHSLSTQEEKRTIDQLLLACSINRKSCEPFHITFTDLAKDSYCHKQLSHQLSNCYIKTEASFMDVFPSDKLIYLTPDSQHVMRVYDPEAVYIIGGIVDKKSSHNGSTLAKAKRLKIRTAKFPIDSNIPWKKGTKSLTLNQVLSILHSKKDGGDWQQAFRHIPSRKKKYFVKD